MKRALLFVVMMLVLSLATGGRAAVFNVTTPAELGNALNAAENNGETDTINIAPGIFDTSGTTFSYFCPPGENYPLTIAGAGAGNTVLDGNGSNQVLNINTMALANDGAAHVTVSGISFQNGNTGGLGGGLYVGTSRADITVEHCAFGGNTANHGGGAYALSSGPPSGNVTFTNNTFSGNTANTNGGGAFAGSDSGVTFTNNTFSGNTVNRDGGGFFISLFENAATGNIYNNVTWGNTATRDGDDILVDDDGDGDLTGATVNLYNNDYGPDANDFVIRVRDHFSAGSNIQTDPLFVDPAMGDLHLQAGSPCIDNGTATAPSLPGTDCDGEPRTIGSAPDMGADEVPATLSTPLPFWNDDDGGCFIATAAYGSALSNEVTVLRQFRDDYLLNNEVGKAFVSTYYRYSPPLAHCIAKYPVIRRVVRIGLYPILELSKWCVEESGPERLSKKSE